MKTIIRAIPAVLVAAWIGWLARSLQGATKAQTHAMGQQIAIIIGLGIAATIVLVALSWEKKPAQQGQQRPRYRVSR